MTTIEPQSPSDAKTVRFANRTIARIPLIDQFLEEELAQDVRYYAGWGAKSSARLADNMARILGGTAIYLEDGFLRSFGAGAKVPAISLVVDHGGIYYDATRPSDLESMLASGRDLLAGREAGIARLRARIVDHEISKYNDFAPIEGVLPEPDGTPRVLVIDQTAGDLSIALGLADATTFTRLLDAALIENPDATIIVKTHPVTASGAKRGHLAEAARRDRVHLVTQPVSPQALIAQADKVYAVSSTMGFEALLAGKPVTLFGMPWYGGWGATDDRASCERRNARRSVDELFAAAYLDYARYIDPVSHGRGTIEDALDWLERQRETQDRLHPPEGPSRIIGVGFRRWKQANMRPLLGLRRGDAQFVPDAATAEKLAPGPNDRLLSWGAESPSELGQLSARTGAELVQVEDGFIRSVGLGSDLVAPRSLVLDDEGIYFDPRYPSALETILSDIVLDDAERARARELREEVVRRKVTKYNLEAGTRADWPSEGRRVVFVPGQVEDDASIRLGCGEVRTNAGLLAAARQEEPDAFIVYKPHPDVASRNRRGKVALKEARRWADHIETQLSVVACIEAADAVHTMTSLSGFDALLRGCEVVTYGQPFYAGWGLTTDRMEGGNALARRTRTLDLDALVAGTLLRYPLYWDPVLQGYTTAEAVVRQVAAIRSSLEDSGRLQTLRKGPVRRLARKARVLIANARGA